MEEGAAIGSGRRWPRQKAHLLSSCAMLALTSGISRASVKRSGSIPIGKAATRVRLPLSSTPAGQGGRGEGQGGVGVGGWRV